MEQRENGYSFEEVKKMLIAEEERQDARANSQSQSSGFAGGVKRKHGEEARCEHNFGVSKCWTCHPEKAPQNSTCKDCQLLGHFNRGSFKCNLNPKKGGSANFVTQGMQQDESENWTPLAANFCGVAHKDLPRPDSRKSNAQVSKKVKFLPGDLREVLNVAKSTGRGNSDR
jgi:hypothetical protein